MPRIPKHPWRHVVRGAGWLAGVVALLLSVDNCRAQCVELTERTPADTMQMFASAPSALLQVLRNDRDKLEARLTGILVTNPKLLPAVAKLINDAPTADRPAIGKALRQAELRCVISQPNAARKINNFVRELGDRGVTAGYVAVTEEPTDEPSVGNPPDISVAKPARTPTGPKSLFTGDWNTDLADPFESVPLPLE